MTSRVIVTPAAESDLGIAYRYIRRQSPDAARDWLRRARQSAKSLARRPERCPLAPESVSFNQPIRELFVGSGNRGTYRFLFVVLDRTVYILHVRHGSRCFRFSVQGSGQECPLYTYPHVASDSCQFSFGVHQLAELGHGGLQACD